MSKCPTCESPQPSMHPATQHEGEVLKLCRDPWHKPTAEEWEAEYRRQGLTCSDIQDSP